jgi:ABC-2 type transport system permease protein
MRIAPSQTTSVEVPPPWVRIPVEIATLSRRTMRRFTRHPNLLAIVVVQPLLIVFLFRYVLGGAIEVPGMSYVEFLFPGIFVFVIVQGSGNAGIGLAEEMGSGVLDRFRALPITGVSLLIGRTIADLVKNAITIVVIGVVAVGTGFHVTTGFSDVVAALAITLAFGVAIAWLSFAVTLLLGTVEAVQGGLLILTLALSFVSNSFVPSSTMPNWLRVVVDESPVSKVVGTVRSLTTGVGVPPTTAAITWIVLLLALAVPVTAWRYRRL